MDVAKITINLDVEVDDALLEKVVNLISTTTQSAAGIKIPEGLELELRDVGGRLVLKAAGVGDREGELKG